MYITTYWAALAAKKHFHFDPSLVSVVVDCIGGWLLWPCELK